MTKYFIKNKYIGYTEVTYKRFIEFMEKGNYNSFKKGNKIFIYEAEA